jgi:anhydro-N-acetylmuramic acid kinase
MTARPERRIAVGLMTGNSLDGISSAVVATRGVAAEREVEFLAYRLHPLSDELRVRLLALHHPAAFTAVELLGAHLECGAALGDAAAAVIAEAGLTADEVAVVGVQGANLIHAIGGRDADNPVTGHMELGELAEVAERAGTVVVGDLRPSDVARGGEGAPLSSYVDHLLFGRRGTATAVQNIGGIANVTYVPADGGLDDLLSFDCGPGNMVIDRLVARFSGGRQLYDEDGERAARGRVHQPLLDRLLEHPYLALAPPKTSRGPEEFGDPLVRWLVEQGEAQGISEDDLVATATQYSAECMASHYERFFPALPDEVVLTVGGAHNL